MNMSDVHADCHLCIIMDINIYGIIETCECCDPISGVLYYIHTAAVRVNPGTA